MGAWWNDLNRWLTDVSLVFVVFFVLWVLWGMLQYFSKVPNNRSSTDRSSDDRSGDADRYRYEEKQWTKRSTLRR